jgi:hypothetical protein
MQAQCYRAFALTLTVVTAARSGCEPADLPAAYNVVRATPQWVQDGTKRRLNLSTPEARARVAYKAPVQGVKNAEGTCVFSRLGEMRADPTLTALVGEWDTNTCAGLLYYFRANPSDPPQKPTREDTVVVIPPPA